MHASCHCVVLAEWHIGNLGGKQIILGVSDDEKVSSIIIGETFSSETTKPIIGIFQHHYKLYASWYYNDHVCIL